MKKKVLIFSAHPDDAEIGMGGTISYLIDKGFDVISFVGYQHNIVRILESKSAAKFLKIKEIHFLSFLNNNKREIIEKMDKCIETYKPHSVFTQFLGDSHHEHKIVAECVLSAARSNNFNVYMFEEVILGGLTERIFKPQLFIDISKHMDKKIKSIKLHKSQIKKNNNLWLDGLKGRAKYRGYQCNVKYAEVFEIIKQIGL